MDIGTFSFSVGEPVSDRRTESFQPMFIPIPFFSIAALLSGISQNATPSARNGHHSDAYGA